MLNGYLFKPLIFIFIHNGYSYRIFFMLVVHKTKYMNIHEIIVLIKNLYMIAVNIFKYDVYGLQLRVLHHSDDL